MTSQIIYQGHLRTVAIHLESGTEIDSDAAIENHGTGQRFSPTDLVATALGNCMITTMGIKAAELGIDLTETTVDIYKKMANDPRRIGEIQIIFHFPEGVTIGQSERKSLETAALTSPVTISLNPDIDKDVQFIW
jgi:putative redox protein